MCIFNLGLTYGLSMLGNNAGNLVPTAFMQVEGIASSPLYRYGIGLTIALLFAWFLGFGSTIAEPALSALGMTAEELTNGVFKKKTLILAVSFGVACGIALGLAKLIFNLPLIWLLVGSYSVAAILTLLSSEVFVNVAWDSAGVTTGPVTVPLVLAMGLGFSNATQAVEGFGYPMSGISRPHYLCPYHRTVVTIQREVSNKENSSKLKIYPRLKVGQDVL